MWNRITNSHNVVFFSNLNLYRCDVGCKLRCHIICLRIAIWWCELITIIDRLTQKQQNIWRCNFIIVNNQIYLQVNYKCKNCNTTIIPIIFLFFSSYHHDRRLLLLTKWNNVFLCCSFYVWHLLFYCAGAQTKWLFSVQLCLLFVALLFLFFFELLLVRNLFALIILGWIYR